MAISNRKSKFPPKKNDNSHIIKANPKRDWSDLQKNIFKDIHSATDHTVVIARAGSGKTSVIVEGFKYIPKGKKTLMVAFNKSIAEELKQRAASYIDIMTLHSLGFRAIKQSFGQVTLENDKSRNLVSSLIGDDRDLWELNQSICKCVSLCKGFLCDTPAGIGDLIDKFGIEIFDLTREKFTEYVIKTLALAKAQKQVIDFDDMIWFPFVYRLNVGKWDIVFVDEAQDLNTAQITMVLSAIKPTGRIIAVGDPAQCVDENTLLSTYGTDLSVKDCSVNAPIQCFNNGKIDHQKITVKQKSSWTHGIEILTTQCSTPNKLLMSPNHKIWAKFNILPSSHLVYLTYSDQNKYLLKSITGIDNLQSFFQSLPDQKIWILNIVESYEDVYDLNKNYNYLYYSPAAGLNGDQLLLDTFGPCHQPHWHNSSYMIHLHSHTVSGSVVSYFTDQPKLTTKTFNSYTEAIFFANKLKSIYGGEINETLGDQFILMPACQLQTDMRVLQVKDGKLTPVQIIVNKDKPGVFYDIEVEQAANFIGNGILSHNSIYQFRGADSDAILNFINKLKAKTLPLSLTYRCPKKVVKLAQEIVPDITAYDKSEEGEIIDIDYTEMLKQVKPGDFVLSRTNAPLIKYCLALLKLGVPANIQGRDIGANLLYFIKKSKAKTINGFIDYVNSWRDQEVKRLLSEKKSTDICVDKAECLLNLCEGTLSLQDLKETIEKLFNDVDDSAKVIFSTTHKAKGLERDNVFVLINTYRYGPGITGEEANLYYVAITRAKKRLYLVSKPSKYAKYDGV